MAETYKLSIHLVPQPLWERNIRHLFGKYQWQKFRKFELAKTGLSCSVCGFEAEKTREIFLHEDWEYDETTDPYTVRLKGLATACWNCHSTEHWGLTERMVASGVFPPGTEERLIQHWAKVNGVDEKEFVAHRKRAFDKFSDLSGVREWQWDFGPFQNLVRDEFGDDDPFEGWPLIY